MTARLGMAPIGWMNGDKPEISAHISVDQCLSEVHDCGYVGVELCARMPTTADELGPLLDKYDLKLISGWYGAELSRRSVEEEIEAQRPQMDLFKALGAPNMVVAETAGSVQGQFDTPVSQRPKFSDEDWKPYGAKLTQLAEYMAGEGVPMAFHHHMGTYVETEDEVDKLMNNTGEAVHLLIDTGHMKFAGGDWLATLKRWGKRLNHVHVKDIREPVLADLKANDGSFFAGVLDGVFTVPGDGSIDYAPFFRELAEQNYDGWIMVEAEQDPKVALPDVYGRMAYSYCMETAEKVGLGLVS